MYGVCLQLKSLYLMDQPTCWSSVQIGVFLALRDGVSRLGSLTLIALLQQCVLSPVLVILGAMSETAGDLVMGLATTDLVLYMGEFTQNR
jgi:hypothetical protein